MLQTTQWRKQFVYLKAINLQAECGQVHAVQRHYERGRRGG